jgi:hypothetical protein
MLIYFGKGYAQIPVIFSDKYSDSSKTRVGVASDFFANANALTADFINVFYNGGHIDVNLKDKVLVRTKNSNRVGAELNNSVFAAFRLDSLCHKAGYNLFFSIRGRQHFDCHYPKDFYKVGFYGNAAYAGKEANFANFGVNLIRYQQFQIGLFSTKLDTNARWGISLSFLKGEQYQSIFAKKAMLYTSPDGQYITFDTEMEMAESDPAHKGIKAMNGFGMSMDFYFESPFHTKIGETTIAVSVSDIGLIRFNDNSIYRHQDSLFKYDGFHINSIFDISDSTFLKTSQDSIKNKVLPPTRRSVTATLPSTLNLSIETVLSENFHLIGGIHHIFNANYTFQPYVKGNIYFNKYFMISATIGYGGYGGFNSGLGLGIKTKSGIALYAGTNNFEGFIAPSEFAGRAAYLSIIKHFN